MIQRNEARAGVAVLGLILGGMTLPSISGCDQSPSAGTAANKTENGGPKLSYDGRALLVEFVYDGSVNWSYPIDLIGNYSLKTYPSTSGNQTTVVTDLSDPAGTLKYRFEFKYEPSNNAVGFIAMNPSQGTNTFMVTPSNGNLVLTSASLTVKDGATLARPQELFTAGSEPKAHRFTDLAGKSKRIMVIPQ